MTLFEYMSVAVSIIVALAFAEGLRGLKSALHPDRRYSVHVVWLFIKLSNPLLYWWALWAYREFPEFWNIGTFTIMLACPCLMYLQLLSLVTDNPDKITDWRQHFYSQRKWFFGINAILSVPVILLSSRILVSVPLNYVAAVAYTIIGVLSVVGFLTDSPRFHGFMVSLVAGFTVFYYGVATFGPVSMG